MLEARAAFAVAEGERERARLEAQLEEIARLEAAAHRRENTAPEDEDATRLVIESVIRVRSALEAQIAALTSQRLERLDALN